MKISDEKTMFTYSHLKTFIEQCQWIFQTLPQSTTDEENNDNNRKKTLTIHSTVRFRSVYEFEQSLVSDDFKIRYQMLYIYVMWTWKKIVN